MHKVKTKSQVVAAFAFATAVLSACDSENSIQATNLTPAVNVSDLTRFSAAVSAPGSDGNLLVNPGFEQPLGSLPGWSACVDDANLSRSVSGLDNMAVNVSAGDCIQQAVEVSPGDELALSCDASAWPLDLWSGLGMSFYDSSWNFLSEPDAAVVAQSGFETLAVNGIAPPDSSYVAVWFYTDAGGTLDNCQLVASGTEPPDGKQNYRYTAVVNKSFARGDFGPAALQQGSPSVYGNGYRSSQLTLIDGVETENFRNTSIAIGQNGEYLYIWTFISKPTRDWRIPGLPVIDNPLYQDSYPVNGRLWDDESFEIYINAGNEDTVGYDQNDFNRIYGFTDDYSYAPEFVTGVNSQLALTNSATCVVGELGGTQCGIRFSFEELGIAGLEDPEIGFDIHWNFDDDGGDRDAKYSWCGGNTVTAWENMSTVECSLVLR